MCGGEGGSDGKSFFINIIIIGYLFRVSQLIQKLFLCVCVCVLCVCVCGGGGGGEGGDYLRVFYYLESLYGIYVCLFVFRMF